MDYQGSVSICRWLQRFPSPLLVLLVILCRTTDYATMFSGTTEYVLLSAHFSFVLCTCACFIFQRWLNFRFSDMSFHGRPPASSSLATAEESWALTIMLQEEAKMTPCPPNLLPIYKVQVRHASTSIDSVQLVLLKMKSGCSSGGGWLNPTPQHC